MVAGGRLGQLWIVVERDAPRLSCATTTLWRTAVGFLSVTLGGDPRVGTIAPFNSGVTGAQMSELDALHGPVLLINGGEVDFMYETSAANFDAINDLPAFYGARDNAGHTGTVFHPGGGEFANVASNWLRYVFKDNEEAGAMFVGADCTLCTDSNWETRSKGLE